MTPSTPDASQKRFPWLLQLRQFVLGGSIVCLLGGAGLLVSRSQGLAAPGAPAGKEGQKAAPALPVQVALVQRKAVELTLSALGTVTSLNTVTIKSRVDGQLQEVNFQEGQMVKAGDLLAVIDPRPFQVLLSQAEGQLARDQELLNNARLDLTRYQTLAAQDSIPRQQLDSQEALVRQLEAAIKVDQGQVDGARLQLSYSRITAPIDGRLGLRLVDPGNMVHAADPGGLVVIAKLQPISVIFPIAEDNLPKVLAKLKAGKTLSVQAYDRAFTTKLASGTLLTVDNQIDPSTGSVKLKASFANREGELFPNQFVNIRLLVDHRPAALVVPAAAVQRGPKGTFVYLVKEDATVAMQPVGVELVQEGEAIVAKGLTEGEQVVTDGAERLRDGAKVEIKNSGQERGEKGGDR